VDNRIDSIEGRSDSGLISNVSGNQLYGGRWIRNFVEIAVEDSDGMSGRDKSRNKRSTDVPKPAGHKN
jgi:hypothetical protein